MPNVKNLKPVDFPQLIWQQGDALNSIEKLFNHVTGKANEAIDWYYSKKEKKRIVGYVFRYSALVLTALAGIIPAFASVYKEYINPLWSTVAIAVAALLVAIDKFGGFTTAWIRYILTAQKLDIILEEFRFNWEIEKLKLANTNAEALQIQSLIEKCRDFIAKIQAGVKDETEKWAAEFQSNLKEIDDQVKAAYETAKANAAKEQYGAICLQIENRSELTNDWNIKIDDELERKCTGKKETFTNIKPGLRKIVVTGRIKENQGKEKVVKDSKAIKITAGGMTDIKMKLE